MVARARPYGVSVDLAVAAPAEAARGGRDNLVGKAGSVVGKMNSKSVGRPDS